VIELSQVIIPESVRGFASGATLFDVQIDKGQVRRIQPADDASLSGANLAARGTLIPALVDSHVHLDKTYVVHEVGAADGDLFKAIGLMAEHRARWRGPEIHQRMARAIQEAYFAGTRAMRTHLDWPQATAPRSLAEFEQLRDAWRGRMALQCASLTPLDEFGTTGKPGSGSVDTGEHIARQLAQVNARCNPQHGEAALLGAFVYRNDGLQQKLQRVFALAAQYQLNLDFHVDEGLDTDACGLRAIAELTLESGFKGRVTCGHACSLSVQQAEVARSTLRLCAQAGIHLVALPSTNLYLQGAWDQTPLERGITRLNEAAALGVPTSIATDNVADGFFPYGSYDLLDTFALGVQVGHLSPAQAWLPAVCTRPALALGLPWDGRIAEGFPADLILLQARSGFELVTPAGRQRRVIRHGEFLEPPT
jgi:cytosine/creatinine deaminase